MLGVEYQSSMRHTTTSEAHSTWTRPDCGTEWPVASSPFGRAWEVTLNRIPWSKSYSSCYRGSSEGFRTSRLSGLRSVSTSRKHPALDNRHGRERRFSCYTVVTNITHDFRHHPRRPEPQCRFPVCSPHPRSNLPCLTLALPGKVGHLLHLSARTRR